MDTIRINKFIAEAGVCSRREADRLIQDGKVKINGEAATLGVRVSARDIVMVNDKRITAETQKLYIAFNKPYGVITTSDKLSNNNVLDYVKTSSRVYPIGRLDVQSSGLLLLTNDGSIVNTILKSENKKEKEYIVTLDRPIAQNDLQQLRDGVMLDDQMTLPANVKKLSDDTLSLILVQGLNRQIRRMCKELGYGIVSLERIRVGNIHLGDLKPGESRNLTEREVQVLLK